MDSQDPRGRYTMDTCRLDRKVLCDLRKEIIDAFLDDLMSAMLTAENPFDTMQQEINRFITDAFGKPKNEFLGFRRHIAENLLLEIAQDAVYEYLT